MPHAQHRFHLALALTLAGLTPAACAQGLPAPELKPGQTWVYRETDLLTGRETGQATDTVVARTGTDLWMRQARGNAVSWWRLDAGTGALREQFEATGDTPEQRGRGLAGNDGGCAWPWPLQPGASWECSEHATLANGWKLRYDLKFTVQGPEGLQVEAGRFDALRVVARGYFTNLTNNATGSHERVLWLAAGTGRELKSEVRTLLRNGKPTRAEGRELVSFKAGG